MKEARTLKSSWENTHRVVTESQNGWVWKGHLVVIGSNPSAHAGPSRVGPYSGLCPKKFEISTRMETAQSVSLGQCSVTITVKSVSWYSEGTSLFHVVSIGFFSVFGHLWKTACFCLLYKLPSYTYTHEQEPPKCQFNFIYHKVKLKPGSSLDRCLKAGVRCRPKPWTSVLGKVSSDTVKQFGLLSFIFLTLHIILTAPLHAFLIN